MTSAPRFKPRISTDNIAEWAKRYDAVTDAPVDEIAPLVRERGFYTREEFLTAGRWKSPRTARWCESNSAESIERATRIALGAADELTRIWTPQVLSGVLWPTSSVLLHFGHQDPYPILDYRALWTLGLDEPPAEYTFGFWWAYVEECRAFADQAGTDMRTLDRALWQFSKENQGRRVFR